MSKSCLDCDHCKVKFELRTLKHRNRKFKHSHPVVEAKLNSRFIPGRVRCEREMWAREDGTEFTYKSFTEMMQRVRSQGIKGHLTMAEACGRYDHG